MAGFAGALAGMGQLAHEKNLLDLQDRMRSHGEALDALKTLSANEDADPDIRNQALQMYLQTATMPTAKYDHKKTGEAIRQIFADYGSRQAARARMANTPQTVASQPINIPAPPPGAPQHGIVPAERYPMDERLPNGQPAMNVLTAPPLVFDVAPPPGMPTQIPAQVGTAPMIDLRPEDAYGAIDVRRGDERKRAADAARYRAMYGEQYDAMLRERRGLNQLEREENDAVVKDLQNDIDKNGVSAWDKLTATQQASVKSRRAIPQPAAALARPAFMGTSFGASAPEGTIDTSGNPVKPDQEYRVTKDIGSGQLNWFPVTSQVGRAIMPDQESPTGFSTFQIDRQGNVQGKTPGALPPAAYAPTVRNGQIEQVVDFGDHKEVVTLNRTNTTQRNVPGISVPPPPMPISAPAQATPQTAPQQAAPVPAKPSGGTRRVLGAKNLSPQQQMQAATTVTVPAHILFGDPDDESFKPLSSYSRLADNKDSRERVGQALRLILDAGGNQGAEHLGATVGPVNVSAGNVGELLSLKMGVPQAVAKERVKVIQNLLSDMEKNHPEEVDYLNQLFNSIPAITAMRSITRGGAFKWSQEALERELPMIGIGAVTGSRAYKQKLANLGNELSTFAGNIPGKPVDARLIELVKKGGKDFVSPTAPPAREVTRQEYDALPKGATYMKDGVTYIKK